MASLSIELVGVKELKSFMNDLSKQSVNGMNKAVARASIFVQGEVKDSIAGRKAETKSVDTGRFLNSVGIRVGNQGAEVFSDLSYAKFLEFGTGKFAARRHFNNTAVRSKEKVREIFSDEIVRVIKSIS